MKTIIIALLMCFTISATYAQEFIAESTTTASIFNPETFQTEVTKIKVYLDNVWIRWDNDGSTGTFFFDAHLETEGGNQIVNRRFNRPVSLLDVANPGKSIHDYVRDQIVAAVVAVAPFGLTTFTKQY